MYRKCNGYFVAPMLLDNAGPGNVLFTEGIFGPVAVVAQDPDHAFRLADHGQARRLGGGNS